MSDDFSARRRKRPRVADENRKRAAQACQTCRRMKEKCQGGQPCERCMRIGRPCEIVDRLRDIAAQEATVSGQNDFCNIDRIKLLERIVTHYTSSTNFDIATLASILESIEPQPPAHSQNDHVLQSHHRNDIAGDNGLVVLRSTSPEVSSEELSHSRFSTRVQERVDSQLRVNLLESQKSVCSASTPSQLHSKSSIVREVAATFPPLNIAHFLFDVFFRFAQTNYSYVDEQSLRQKLLDFYAHSLSLTIEDAPWMSTSLMMFAIGTQFAHLRSTQEDGHTSGIHDYSDPYAGDDEVALSFYRSACKLIPDVMAAASIESVQAFLLFGVFALPMDATRLSCTYFGIAIRIATQNNMHRPCHRKLKCREIELRKRIWWTTYTLERRICILHGRPVSIMSTEVKVSLPTECASLTACSRPDTLPNILAMVQLTGILEEARDIIFALKNGSNGPRVSMLKSLLNLKQGLRRYWTSLSNVVCRDLSPNNRLFRYNTHLALTYHLIHIFIGRSFIFDKPENDSSTGSSGDVSNVLNEMRNLLVDECMQSAQTVVALCQELHDGPGLARASYTESSTCCAALLALLAQIISSSDHRLKDTCDRGMILIRKMLVGIYSQNQDKMAVEVLEAAVSRLNRVANNETVNSISTYAQFSNWVGAQCSESQDYYGTSTAISHSIPRGLDPLRIQPTYEDRIPMLNQSEIDELSILPGLDDWFEFSID